MKASVSANYEALPQELRDSKIWLLWRYEFVEQRLTKVPYRADEPSRRAQSNNPQTWSSFACAVSSVTPNFDGIGLCMHGELAGVDLDSCRNAETGEIADWARHILARFNSYAEVSPSGKGVHILMRLAAPLPKGKRKLGDKEKGWEIGLFDRTSPAAA